MRGPQFKGQISLKASMMSLTRLSVNSIDADAIERTEAPPCGMRSIRFSPNGRSRSDNDQKTVCTSRCGGTSAATFSARERCGSITITVASGSLAITSLARIAIRLDFPDWVLAISPILPRSAVSGRCTLTSRPCPAECPTHTPRATSCWSGTTRRELV